MTVKLRDGRRNLRGLKVDVFVDGKWRRVKVVTHIRDGVWMVEGYQLPIRCRNQWSGLRRVTVPESDIRLP